MLIIILCIALLFIALGVNTRAETGYGGSSVVVTYGGTYNGGGTGGYSGGSSFTFCPTKRTFEKIREWVKTTCDQYEQGISGPLRMPVDWEGFSTADGNPPAALINAEVVNVSATFGSRTVAAVIFLESYKVTASSSEGCHIFLRGRSDGSFSVT